MTQNFTQYKRYIVVILMTLDKKITFLFIFFKIIESYPKKPSSRFMTIEILTIILCYQKGVSNKLGECIIFEINAVPEGKVRHTNVFCLF